MTAAELKKWCAERESALFDEPIYEVLDLEKELREAMVVAVEAAQGMICHNKACPHRMCEASDIRALIAELKEKP